MSVSSAYDLLDRIQKSCSPLHLSLGDLRAALCFPLISRLPHGKNGCLVIADDSGIKLPALYQFLIKVGVQSFVTPLRTYKTFSLQGDLSSLEHRIVCPARVGVDQTLLRRHT
jgi:hypothetical protein